MRFFVFIFLMLAGAVQAQVRDSVFATYDDYAAFVDKRIQTRDFIELVQVLGGRDEYTPEQLRSVDMQLKAAFPVDLQNASVFRKEDLGGGVVQEARIYWTGEVYAFFYAILHMRGDDLVVINFTLNSSINEIMAKF
ncbi:MAG: hypothetical protein KDK26_01295 [Roseivivax sp.]|nr:hypothetical protein [Roseivivax sp.]